MNVRERRGSVRRVEADLNISVSAVFNIKVFVSHHLLRIKEK